MYKKREDFSVHLQNLVVSECKNGISYRKIAEKYKVSNSAVHKICKKYLQHNTTNNTLHNIRNITYIILQMHTLIDELREKLNVIHL